MVVPRIVGYGSSNFMVQRSEAHSSQKATGNVFEIEEEARCKHKEKCNKCHSNRQGSPHCFLV